MTVVMVGVRRMQHLGLDRYKLHNGRYQLLPGCLTGFMAFSKSIESSIFEIIKSNLSLFYFQGAGNCLLLQSNAVQYYCYHC